MQEDNPTFFFKYNTQRIKNICCKMQVFTVLQQVESLPEVTTGLQMVKLRNPFVISGFYREIIGSETSVKNYHCPLRNNPEKHSSVANPSVICHSKRGFLLGHRTQTRPETLTTSQLVQCIKQSQREAATNLHLIFRSRVCVTQTTQGQFYLTLFTKSQVKTDEQSAYSV